MIIVTTPERLDAVREEFAAPTNSNTPAAVESASRVPAHAEAHDAIDTGRADRAARTVDEPGVIVNARELRYVNIVSGMSVRVLTQSEVVADEYTIIDALPTGAHADLERIRRTRVLYAEEGASLARLQQLAEQCARRLVAVGEAPHVPLTVVARLLEVLDATRAAFGDGARLG